MSKYYELQTRKVVSAYGGVGSIIETPQGALKIENFDQWPFVKKGLNEGEEYEINDQRLLKRLRYHFPLIKALFRVPTNTAHYLKRNEPADEKSLISAEYFPIWWYCPKCERFRPLNKWWEGWKNTMRKHNMKEDRAEFIKPKCFACYDEAVQRKGKRDKKTKRYHELEQLRFVMTSPQGNIKDIPWELWPDAKKNVKEEAGRYLPIKLDFDKPCCDATDLRYLRSSKFSDLAGVIIKCENCKKSNTLEGLFSLRVGSKEKEQFKPVIRSSTSVYYPITLNSIFIPTREIKEKDIDAIKDWLNDGENADFIYKALKKEYPLEMIEKFIGSGDENKFESEIVYRTKEYDFLLNPQIPGEKDRNEFSVKEQKTECVKEYGINNLLKLKRIKLVTTQTAYTRQEPYDKDLFLGNNEENNQIKFKYTSKWGRNTEYLPAIDSYGEGIFFSFDPDKIEKWFEEYSKKNSKYHNRLEKVQKNSQKDRYTVENRFCSLKFLAKFMLIHTLSHLVIKELEFIVGYPATSLNERLFVDEDKMHGVLIYTVAGAEGSYGGLVSQANPHQFKRLLESALFRARDCASDPVCFNAEEQGIGGLNLAACYSCALLPEISCEEFNCFLDRALLIHEEYGYFSMK